MRKKYMLHKTLSAAVLVLAMGLVSCEDELNSYTVNLGENLDVPEGRTGEPVDLGLSVLWADVNVGASEVGEYGNYYAWGETEARYYYDWRSYKYCKSSFEDMTKYCCDSLLGVVDNKKVLDLEDDVAHVKWGGDWRMPTEDEMKELYENCTWTKDVCNMYTGYRLTGPNGNSIFLPNAGYRYREFLRYDDAHGNYWTSTLSNRSNKAAKVYFYSSNESMHLDYRFYGFSVRPVCPRK